MKSIIFLFSFISISILLESCEPVIQSLHPLYSDDVLIEEANIEGTWYYNNDKTDTIYWEVKSTKTKKYLVKVSDNKDKNKEVFFSLHLLTLKKEIYADLFLVEENSIIDDSDPGAFLISHIIPVHSFSKLQIKKNTVEVQYFAAKWLKVLLKEHKNCIDYRKTSVSECGEEDCILLTSPPKKLQKLIIRHGDSNSKLKDNKLLFKRLKAANK